jgi:hypothetical protein
VGCSTVLLEVARSFRIGRMSLAVALVGVLRVLGHDMSLLEWIRDVALRGAAGLDDPLGAMDASLRGV